MTALLCRLGLLQHRWLHMLNVKYDGMGLYRCERCHEWSPGAPWRFGRHMPRSLMFRHTDGGDPATPDAAENCETGPISSLQTGHPADQPAQEGERPAKPYHQPERGRRNPDPTPDELADPLFEAIWQTIKGWDVDTNGSGYHGATGNEAAAILRAIRNLRDGGGA